MKYPYCKDNGDDNGYNELDSLLIDCHSISGHYPNEVGFTSDYLYPSYDKVKSSLMA